MQHDCSECSSTVRGPLVVPRLFLYWRLGLYLCLDYPCVWQARSTACGAQIAGKRLPRRPRTLHAHRQKRRRLGMKKRPNIHMYIIFLCCVRGRTFCLRSPAGIGTFDRRFSTTCDMSMFFSLYRTNLARGQETTTASKKNRSGDGCLQRRRQESTWSRNRFWQTGSAVRGGLVVVPACSSGKCIFPTVLSLFMCTAA